MLNQLLPQKGTVHYTLTQSPIDLSAKKYNTRTYTRKSIIAFIAEQLEQNPNIVTFLFLRRANWANVLVVFDNKSAFKFGFSLLYDYKYDSETKRYKRVTLREHLTRMLQEQTSPYQVDYPHIQDFAYS